MVFRDRMPSGLVWLGMGLAVGLGMAGFWPHTPLHAVATDRAETFAMATGYCDETVEAVWFLDFLTGDLRAAALAKQNGTFNAFFAHNVCADLGVSPAQNPRFLIATGTADLRRSGGSRVSPSRSILYVAEITSGKVAAYSIPWSSSAWVSGQRMSGQIVLLDVTRFRGAMPTAVNSGKEKE